MRHAPLVLLLLVPLAAAQGDLAGEDRVELRFSDDGSIKASATHDYSSDEWLRTYALDVSYERVGVYVLDRLQGADAFSGPGEMFVAAHGTLRIQLDDQGFTSTLDCTLDHNVTVKRHAFVAEVDGVLVVSPDLGLLDADLWSCKEDGDGTHGGAADVPVAGYALGATQGLAAGTFPAELAVLLGFADDEAEWESEQDKEGFASDLVATGFVEAEPKLGRQEVPFDRTWDMESTPLAYVACGDIGVTDTPPTSHSCRVTSDAVVELLPADARTPIPDSTGAAEGKDAPSGGALAALAGAVAAALLVARRR